MHVYVCVKHVPDTAASINVIGETGFDETVKFVINPYDEYAVEEAIRVASRLGGEVAVVSVGRQAAINTIRSALAMGADRGILVKTSEQFLDSSIVGLALQKAIEMDRCQPDLIIMGRQSIDCEGLQTPYRLARLMNMPVATDVVALTLDNGLATVESELGGGDRRIMQMTLPCIIGAARGLNEPRYPKLPDILKAKKKPVTVLDMADLGLTPPPDIGQLLTLKRVPDRGPAKMIQGSTREKVTELVRLLIDEARVL